MNWKQEIERIESNYIDAKLDEKESRKFCDFVTLPLAEIVLEDKDARLRDAQREEEKYKNLMADIATNGLRQPVLVRRRRSDGKFVILDGVQRFSCHQDLNLEFINANYYPGITDQDVGTILCWQVSTNIHRIETKKGDLARQFLRILTLNTGMTQVELADLMNVTQGYVSQIMSLNTLNDHILKMVNDGEINLANAVQLSKLPEDEQDMYVDRAKKMDVTEFAVAVKQRKLILQNEKRGLPKVAWQPTFMGRSNNDLKSSIVTLQGLMPDGFSFDMVDRNDKMFIIGRYYQALWAGHLDPESIKRQVEEHNKEEAEREKKKAERKAQREAEKAAKEGTTVGLPAVHVSQ